MRTYLRLSSDRVKKAQEETKQSVDSQTIDEDLEDTPESILARVSGSDVADRTERHVLVPAVKYLWESYR